MMTFHDTVPIDAANAPRWAAHAASEITDDDNDPPMTPAEAVVALVIWMLSTILIISVAAMVAGVV